MKTAELLHQAKKAETRLFKELEEAEAKLPKRRIGHERQRTRKRVRESVETRPEQKVASDRVEQLQLRCELLRNIRLNWKGFEAHAGKRGIELRINQFSALQHLISFLDTGRGQENAIEETTEIDPSRALMAYEVQPTGAGKTGAFAIEAALTQVPTLILVPFDNLVEQSKEDLIHIGGFKEEDIGLIYGGTKEIGRKITVATYQGHSALMKKSEGEYANFVKTKVKFCICDEVHTSLGERTQESLEGIDGLGNGELSQSESDALDAEEEVLKHLSEEIPVKALKIGFTATPKLAQKHVQKYFPHFLGRVYQKSLIEAGWLVPYRIVQCEGSVFAGEIEKITEKQEIEILDREEIYGKLLGQYAESLTAFKKVKKKNEYPLRGMAFCTNHAECEKFAREAEEHGIRCEIVTGKEARGEKGREVISAAKEKLCSGEIDLIVTVEKLCAGFNFPEVNAIIWARITSMAKTIQGIGRGGRSHREGKMIKECCWVFETNWALKDNAKRGKKPMRLADALVQNGEDPTAACSMADGSILKYESPPIGIIAENGIIEVEVNNQPVQGIGVSAYAKFNGMEMRSLMAAIEKASLSVPILGKARSGNNTVDVYDKTAVDSLEYVSQFFAAKGNKVGADGVVSIAGQEGVELTQYASGLGVPHKGLKKVVEDKKIDAIGKARMHTGKKYADIYAKSSVDQLDYVKNAIKTKEVIVDEFGIARSIADTRIVGVDINEYAEFKGVSVPRLTFYIEQEKIPITGYGKSKHFKRAVPLYDKEKIDNLEYVKKGKPKDK